MQVVQVNTKKRFEFGKPCVRFSEQPAEIVLSVENYENQIDNNGGDDGEPKSQKFFLNSEVQLGLQYSEHEVNTERCETESRGMCHLEGGWPKDVSLDDLDQLKRYRKKVEKDELFLMNLFKLSKRIEECAKQHIAIDIYEKDIEESNLMHKLSFKGQSAVSSIQTVSVISDPSNIERAISTISWNPGDQNRIALGFRSSNVRKQPGEESKESTVYIFDSDKPQKPAIILECSETVSSLAYNPKDSTQLLIGYQNGYVSVFDVRKGAALGTFLAHKAPVQSSVWLQTKSGAEFLTGSQDGRVCWWDSRKMGEEATEVLEVTPKLDEGETKPRFNNLIGVTAVEFESTMPTKLLIGTEKGLIFQGNRKGKTNAEKLGQSLKAYNGHIGSVQRNPFYPKFFLATSHTKVSIWCDDVKESAILNLKPSTCTVSAACWSVTRPTIIFIATKNGMIEIFDINKDLENPIESIKICKSPLFCMSVNQSGRRLAAGNSVGKLYLIDIPESIYALKKNEKSLASTFFEREQRKEKFVEASKKEASVRIRSAKKSPQQSNHDVDIDVECEKDFVEEEQSKELVAVENESFEIFDNFDE